MGDTKIEWCDKSWNPIVGCTKCSPGCLNCYAERMVYRLACMGIPKYQDVTHGDGGWSGNVIALSDQLDKPLHWRKPKRIFVCSMSDLFHEKVPFEFILKVIGITIVTPWHNYLILTKRPNRMYDFFACYPDGWFIREAMKHSSFSNEFFAIDSIEGLLAEKTLKKANAFWKYNYDQSERGKLDGPVPFPQPNLHLGVSISTQAEADEKIPILLQIPAAVRWVSVEPMLGPIDLRCLIVGPRRRCVFDCLRGTAASEIGVIKETVCGTINWVVVGCESGPGRRPCNTEWVRSIVEQCKNAGIPVFVKQVNVQGKVIKMPQAWPQELPE